MSPGADGQRRRTRRPPSRPGHRRPGARAGRRPRHPAASTEAVDRGPRARPRCRVGHHRAPPRSDRGRQAPPRARRGGPPAGTGRRRDVHRAGTSTTGGRGPAPGSSVSASTRSCTRAGRPARGVGDPHRRAAAGRCPGAARNARRTCGVGRGPPARGRRRAPGRGRRRRSSRRRPTAGSAPAPRHRQGHAEQAVDGRRAAPRPARSSITAANAGPTVRGGRLERPPPRRPPGRSAATSVSSSWLEPVPADARSSRPSAGRELRSPGRSTGGPAARPGRRRSG